MSSPLPDARQALVAPEPALERRRRQPPATPREYLEQMPALVLLDRLPTPMLAVGLDGQLIYANPAMAASLGYPDVGALVEQSLPILMSGHGFTSEPDCLTALQAAAGHIVNWCHVDGYRVHTVVSAALLTRATDPLLLITLTDVSELQWSSKP